MLLLHNKLEERWNAFKTMVKMYYDLQVIVVLAFKKLYELLLISTNPQNRSSRSVF